MIPAALTGIGLSVEKSYFGGDGETNLSKWGKGAFIGTKFTPTPWRRSARDVVEACRAAASRLEVDSIDLYQIQMPDVIQPYAAFGKVDIKDKMYWEGLAECFRLGLVKNVGVSNYGPALVAEAQEFLAMRGVPLASNQIPYNLMCRRQGQEATVRACRDMGVAVLAYYPLAMGLLAGLRVDQVGGCAVVCGEYVSGGGGGGRGSCVLVQGMELMLVTG
jgi:pyridoxine 4-dehydrogenase